MGRFFKVQPLQFMQDTMYRAPHEMMMKVLDNDNRVRALYEEQASKAQESLLATPHLAFDKDRLQSIVKSYDGDIDAITHDIYNNPDITMSGRKKLKALQNRITNDMRDGELGYIASRHSAMEKFKKDNEKLQETDPTTYNLAMAYEMAKLEDRTKADPKAIFNPYRVIGKPQFRKELIDTMEKMKADGIESPDGRGYIIGREFVSKERLMSAAVSAVLGRPEFAEFARQQTKYGVRGYFNEDGTMMNPYGYVDTSGNQVDTTGMTPAQMHEKGISLAFNPNWALASELGGLVNAYSYNKQSVKGDSTWTAKMEESGRNSRHAQDMALRQAEFQYKQQKDQRDYDFEREKWLHRIENGDDGGGYGYGGSGGGKDSKGSNGKNMYTISGAPDIIAMQANAPDKTLASELKNYRNSPNSRAFIETTFANTVRTFGGAHHGLDNKIGDMTVRQRILNAISRGEDLSTPQKMKDYLDSTIRKQIEYKNGGRKATDKEVEAWHKVLDIDGLYNKVNSKVEEYNVANKSAQLNAYGINGRDAQVLMEQIRAEGGNVDVITGGGTGAGSGLMASDAEGNPINMNHVLAQAQNEGSRINMRYVPEYNGSNGGAIRLYIENSDGSNHEYMIQQSAGTENRIMSMAKNIYKRRFNPSQPEYYAGNASKQGFSAGWMDNTNGGNFAIGLEDMRSIADETGIDTSGVRGVRVDRYSGKISVIEKNGRKTEFNVSPSNLDDAYIGTLKAIEAVSNYQRMEAEAKAKKAKK